MSIKRYNHVVVECDGIIYGCRMVEAEFGSWVFAGDVGFDVSPEDRAKFQKRRAEDAEEEKRIKEF